VNHLTGGPHRVGITDVQLALLVLTLGGNVLIAWYEQRRGVELKSELLIADAAHTRVDVFVSVGVVVAVLLARYGWWWIDPVSAIVVAVVITVVAYRILARTVPVLVDQRAIPTRDIQDTAQGVPAVKSAYGIRSRGPSDLRYAEVTIAVDRHADVEAAHAIADQVEARLKRDLQLHEVTVHVEPC
jgi:cation diffusion facilitator family transporter